MIKQIPLTHGKYAIVDAEDYHDLGQWKWYLSKSGYAIRKQYLRENGRSYVVDVLMHRLIMGTAKGQVTDHKNGNRLDNRKENLRICTQAENVRNNKPHGASKFRGVAPCSDRLKFFARISVDGKRVFNKRFNTELEAARAYNENVVKFHGEFAFLNEITDV